LALVAVALVVFLVDLTPRVEGDFFFASDDPQLRASAEIETLFPSRPQVLVSATAPDLRAPETLERLRSLTGELRKVPGVTSVLSAVSGPPSPAAAFEGPFWGRLLAPGGAGGGASGEEASTLLVLELGDGARPEVLVPRLEAVVAHAEAPGFRLAVSGVPFVVELIRRHLLRDLRVFTGAALAVFGLLVALIYRDLRLTLGILATCLTACAVALAVLRLAGLTLGVLTANLVTIVFVLTLSHLVYLTANWRRLAGDPTEPNGDPVTSAMALTGEASFWCMATTLLGFLSLLLASAQPLRELAVAGAAGTLAAFATAYGLYPSFLRVAGRGRRAAEPERLADPFGGRRLRAGVALLAALAAIAAAGLPRIDTDPGLLAFFDRGSEIGRGLAAIDAEGGSSPLRVVFRDAGGGRLDTPEAFERLAAAQAEIETDPEVGTALSLAPLLQEAASTSFAGFLGVPQLVELLSGPAFRGVANSFLSADRTRGTLVLRMREAERGAPRREVVERVEAALRRHGFEPEITGGLYELQGALADLVASSLLVGLGGLALLFAGIAWAVSRSLPASGAMLACLVGTPVFLFGTMGWLGLPVDFISSPAANVALGMGVDSMIHLVVAVRRLRAEGQGEWEAWSAARGRLWRPIVGAATILALGFGLFGLSSFPPTRRFGIAVVIGLAAAAALTLVALPYVSTLTRRSRRT
jgi:predicted RND superfamily exporter protein